MPSVALSSATLGRGDVVLRAQRGYCIDPATLDTGRSSSFAVLASCRILSNGRTGERVPPVLMTVTVGPRLASPVRPDPAHLAGELGVPLLAGSSNERVSLAHLGGAGDTAIDNGDARHWRAAVVVNRRIVGLALYAPENSALAGPEGEALITAFATGLLTDSPEQPEGANPIRGLLSRVLER